MGFFDKENLKSIRKLLIAEWPYGDIEQIPSPYRKDNRDVLRAHIEGDIFLDLAENDSVWFCVIVVKDGVGEDSPSQRRVIELEVKAWAKHQDVAMAYLGAIREVEEIASAYYSMTEEEVDEFINSGDAELPIVDTSSHKVAVPERQASKSITSSTEYLETRSSTATKPKAKWPWVVGLVIFCALIFGGCGSNGWRMGVDGSGSRVQCQDGSWSNSGGKSGACSWHGGVR